MKRVEVLAGTKTFWIIFDFLIQGSVAILYSLTSILWNLSKVLAHEAFRLIKIAITCTLLTVLTSDFSAYRLSKTLYDQVNAKVKRFIQSYSIRITLIQKCDKENRPSDALSGKKESCSLKKIKSKLC